MMTVVHARIYEQEFLNDFLPFINFVNSAKCQRRIISRVHNHGLLILEVFVVVEKERKKQYLALTQRHKLLLGFVLSPCNGYVCNIDRVLGQYRRIPVRTAQP